MPETDRDSRVAIYRANVAAWLDSLRATYGDWPTPASDENPNHGHWRYPIPSGRPRLAEICRWCMDRPVSRQFYTLHHPHFAYLCDGCRTELRMFIQRLALHHAMSILQATEAVMDMIDLAYERVP